MNTTTDLAGAARSRGPAAAAKRAELYARVLERIHRYFRRVVFDPLEAEECVARTLLELERSLDPAEPRAAYDPGRSFNAWMWLKARTVHAQWCRERERRPEPLGEREPAAAARDPDRALDAATVLAEVARRLGPEAHEVFVLHYESGLTLKEVAEIVGRNRETVARRIADAHALIDRLLGGDTT